MHLKKWLIEQPAIASDATSLVDSVLEQRGYAKSDQRARFLSPSLNDLYDPFLMAGMQATIARIQVAIQDQQQIVIYGDYDVDGMTSTAIMYKLLSALSAQVSYYIPSRFDEGYGINAEAIKAIASAGCQLIISVDCGITSVNEAQLAKALAVDLIITDHHEVGSVIPAGFAVLNPKQVNCNYPYNMLAGAGIALKIAQALIPCDGELFKELLVLAAVGTIADLAPIVDENRIIAAQGLKYFRTHGGLGLNALAQVAGLKDKAIGAGQIGFAIGPRLNAVGRLDHAERGVELLVTQDRQIATRLAASLQRYNEERRNLESKIVNEAIAMIESEPIHRQSGCIVVWADGWHEGVIGIVASRLVERYYLPAIVLAQKGDQLKGSARSISGYSIFAALSSQRQFMSKFGGHEQAAGLSMPLANVNQLIAGLQFYNQTTMTAELRYRRIRLAGYIQASAISHHTIDALARLQPHGIANPKPHFAMAGLVVEQVRRIGKGNHAKFMLSANGKLLEAIHFNYPEARPLPTYHSRVDSAFNLAINHFNGVASIQLNQVDIRSYVVVDSLFTRRCYALYCHALVAHLNHTRAMLDSQRLQLRTTRHINQWLVAGQRLAIASYEGLLEVAYCCFDLGIDYQQLIAEGQLSVCPKTLTSDTVLIDPAIYTASDMAMCMYHPSDHHMLRSQIGKLYFDRKVFSQLYLKIKHYRELDMIELLVESSDALLDRLALAFFEEAGFVSIEGQTILFAEGEHRKYNFAGSVVENAFQQFKERLYQLSLKIEEQRS